MNTGNHDRNNGTKIKINREKDRQIICYTNKQKKN